MLGPLDAPPDGPREHARELLAQLLGQLRVGTFALGPLGKRDEAHPVPYRLRPVGDLGLVVCGQPELELRPVGERLAVRRAGADRVVARDLLDGRLLQLHAALRLRHADEPHALKLGKRILRGGVPVSVTHHNVGVRGGAVVPHEVLKHLHQRALAVLAFSTLSSIGSVSSSSGETARSAFASVHIALRRSKLCERLAHSAIFFCSSSSATRSASRKIARAVFTRRRPPERRPDSCFRACRPTSATCPTPVRTGSLGRSGPPSGPHCLRRGRLVGGPALTFDAQYVGDLIRQSGGVPLYTRTAGGGLVISQPLRGCVYHAPYVVFRFVVRSGRLSA